MASARGLVLVIITAIAMTSSLSIPAHAAGVVYINPSNVTPGIGSSFSVQVKVANVDPFNSWDIQIVTDPNVINATSISTDGNLLKENYTATAIPLVGCINGVAVGAGNCDAFSDRLGVVHSAVLFFGAQLPTTGSSNGLLFTINYTVVGTGPYSPIDFQQADLGNGQLSTVIVGLQNGVYGTAPTQDFGLSPFASILKLRLGSSANVTLTVASVGGFFGTVLFENTTSANGLHVSLNATSIVLSSGQQAALTVKVTASNFTSSIQFRIAIRATSGSLFHRVTITVIVAPKSDFILSATPSLLKIHATNSGSSIITLSTQSGFSGSIQLSMAIPPVPGLVASLSNKTITIDPNTPGNSIFDIRTPDSSLPFRYLINVTATNGNLSHSIQIIVQSPSADFSLSVGASSYSVQAGQSRTFTITMTSVDYFKGQIFLLAASLSGAKEVFSRPSVSLDFGNTTTSTLTISTDFFAAPGNHLVTITALGTTFLGANVSHATNMTITILSPVQQTMILGVQPVTYFGVLVALWVALIVVAVREVRRPKPKRFLT